jgi:DNA-directed RNA polymerase specialized sigma24 family protein
MRMKSYISESWLRKKERRELGVARRYAVVNLEREREKEEAEREREKAKRIVQKILSLTELSEVQREVIDYFLEGLSLREIARKRGVHFRAVQKAFRGALKRMKETIKKHNIDPDDEDIDFLTEYDY